MAAAGTVRTALAVVEAADAAASLANLPELLLPTLVTLVGAECALWTELDPAAGSTPRLMASYPGPLLDEQTAAALEKHAQDFPLTCHTRPGGDGRPIRRSDLQSRRNFRSSGMYADVASKVGVDEMLAMALKTGNVHVCVALNRSSPDFTPAAVDLLTQLQPLLTRRVARLAGSPAGRPAVGGRAGWPSRADLTTRQQQVLRLVTAGLTDAAIGRRLGCSPRTVDKHLEHIYRRLGVSCRTAAVAATRTAPMDIAVNE